MKVLSNYGTLVGKGELNQAAGERDKFRVHSSHVTISIGMYMSCENCEYIYGTLVGKGVTEGTKLL